MICKLNAQTINSSKLIKKQAQKNKSVIYGGQSLCRQMPTILKPLTQDYDIYSKHPRKSAEQLEKQLDKRAGCTEAFYTKPAKHKGTWKVKRFDGENVADYTKPKEPVPTKNIQGNKYTTIEYEKQKRLQILKDQSAKYRHLKAQEDLARIRANQFFKGRKKII